MSAAKEYKEYIYLVKGENIEPNPQSLFNVSEVYLIVDRSLKLIWIWTGKRSRLFHRYVASNWAGKLKTKQTFFNFRYETVKDGEESIKFLESIENLKFYNQNTKAYEKLSNVFDKKVFERMKKSNKGPQNYQASSALAKKRGNLSSSDSKRIKTLLAEVKEVNAQVKYSLSHIDKKIQMIENILKKLGV